ncbi:hypothetical protein H0H81_010422 [Sphagnurus paluster]|uniref:Uncharacterized protein n=1 Tax=Sphagnurus paluster TaxID=117069 RepID=A0A9P7K408_9AGAR|nr:hypothetical protein H0H81_010422 [Sphagnurus paluster]
MSNDTEELDKNKKCLHHWFNNNSQKQKTTKPATLSINLNPPKEKTCRLQIQEEYSKKYYRSKIQPLVKEEIEREKLTFKQTLAVIKKKTQEAFDAEPEELRQVIADEISAKSKMAKDDDDHVEAIESVPDVMYQFTQAMAAQTGWAWSVMGGGPDPVNNGRCRTVAFHQGQNMLGHSFCNVHVNYEETILQPYTAFINTIFCILFAASFSRKVLNTGAAPEICQSRALVLFTENAQPTPTRLVASDAAPSQSIPDEDDDDLSMIDPALRPGLLTLPRLSITPPSSPASTQAWLEIHQAKSSLSPGPVLAAQSVLGFNAAQASPLPLLVVHVVQDHGIIQPVPPLPAPLSALVPQLLEAQVRSFRSATLSSDGAFVFPSDSLADPATSKSTKLLVTKDTAPTPQASSETDTDWLSVQGEEWSELLVSLKKIPAPLTPKAAKVSKSKKTPKPKPVRAPASKNKTPKPKPACAPASKKTKAKVPMPATSEDQSELGQGRGMHTRQAPASKEIQALTVDEDGKQVFNVYGNPITNKHKATGNTTLSKKQKT